MFLKSAREVVYLEYPPDRLPPKPTADSDSDGGKWTRFVCINDTHSQTFAVPDGDVLLHSGDLTNKGPVSEFETTMKWLCELPHPVKIIIAGNHDLPLHTDWYESQHERYGPRGKQDIKPILKLLKGAQAQQAGVVYLQDEKHEFKVHEDGKLWRFYGSPWSPGFGRWAFGYEEEAAEERISQFPKTDILLTHGPALNIFDRTIIRENVSCYTLRAHLSNLRPRLHVVGHIHEAHGACIHKWDPANNFAPPTIQNTDPVNSATGSTADGAEPASPEGDEDVELGRTVLVNASNWPKGPLAMRDGVRSSTGIFGGPGFQPVVVDLKE